jgi:hypothetical protein
MATKLYQAKASNLPADTKETNDWDLTILVAGSVGALLAVIAACVVKQRKARVNKETLTMEGQSSINDESMVSQE